MEPALRADFEQSVASVRSRLSEADFAQAWVEGRAMSMEQAIARALEWSD
jgi:hypothetical protein